MWHLETWFSGQRGSASLTVELDNLDYSMILYGFAIEFYIKYCCSDRAEIIRLSLLSSWLKVLQVDGYLFWHRGESRQWSSILRLKPIACKVKRVTWTLSYVSSKSAGMKSLNANQYLPFIILHIFV